MKLKKPSILYHCTTCKKAKLYRNSKLIKKPVRGFDTIKAALAWCIKTNKKVIYEIKEAHEVIHKLPDHHNQFGNAWWVDKDVTLFTCVFSVNKEWNKS